MGAKRFQGGLLGSFWTWARQREGGQSLALALSGWRQVLRRQRGLSLLVGVEKPVIPQVRAWGTLPLQTQVYLATVILLGSLLLLGEWLVAPFHPSLAMGGELLYLAVGVQLANLMPLRTEKGTHWVSMLVLIAAGLMAPGLGVSLIAWMTCFDGRRPGKEIPIWAFLYNGANVAIAYGLATLLVALIPGWWFWSLPLKTLLLTGLVIFGNCWMMAIAFSGLNKEKAWTIFRKSVGWVSLRSMAIMGLLGGLLVVVLMQPIGYVMAPTIFGVMLAIRANAADARSLQERSAQTLQLAAEALDARDHYTRDHSRRVGELASQIGRAIGLQGKDVERLRTAGILHDLGKIGIRDAILNTTEKLTNEEWEILKKHPDIGADMIGNHSALRLLSPIVRFHHERWDGRGYPSGLKGEEIPLGARILAVSDSFDTITAARVYRRSKMTTEEALDDIKQQEGKMYDPLVVAGLFKVYGTTKLLDLIMPVVEDEVAPQVAGALEAAS